MYTFKNGKIVGFPPGVGLPYKPLDGIFDSILNIVDTATGAYNSAAPLLDPLRDQLLTNIFGGGSSNAAPRLQIPQGYVPPTKESVKVNSTPASQPIITPLFITIGAVSLIGIVTLLIAATDD